LWAGSGTAHGKIVSGITNCLNYSGSYSEIISGIAKYYSVDQIENGMGRACGMYGRQERCTQGFGGET
jgi:hypothetical protein